MAWEYFHLKQVFGIKQTAFLDVFERYNVLSYSTTERHEWSVKVHADSIDVGRFVNVGAAGRFAENWAAFKEALSRDRDVATCPIGSIVDQVLPFAERLLIGYSATHDSLKVYVAGSDPKFWAVDCCESITRQAGLGSTLPGKPGIVIRWSIPPDAAPPPRIYLFYEGHEMTGGDVQQYVRNLVGSHAYRILASHRRSAIAFKTSGSCSLYLAADNNSYGRHLAIQLAQGLPELCDRIRNANWVGIPLDQVSADLPSEGNIYVRIGS